MNLNCSRTFVVYVSVFELCDGHSNVRSSFLSLCVHVLAQCVDLTVYELRGNLGII